MFFFERLFLGVGGVLFRLGRLRLGLGEFALGVGDLELVGEILNSGVTDFLAVDFCLLLEEGLVHSFVLGEFGLRFFEVVLALLEGCRCFFEVVLGSLELLLAVFNLLVKLFLGHVVLGHLVQSLLRLLCSLFGLLLQLFFGLLGCLLCLFGFLFGLVCRLLVLLCFLRFLCCLLLLFALLLRTLLGLLAELVLLGVLHASVVVIHLRLPLASVAIFILDVVLVHVVGLKQRVGVAMLFRLEAVAGLRLHVVGVVGGKGGPIELLVRGNVLDLRVNLGSSRSLDGDGLRRGQEGARHEEKGCGAHLACFVLFTRGGRGKGGK
mmetsp:Transcript_23466/g.35426  ORF Transcript_23466/g.35426 Transcript_23466/m.35426 type:complete len:322 (+) Transcript_23466:330-1295(+)